MYGRYTKDLGEYAKDEARRLKQLERQRKKDDRARDKVKSFHFDTDCPTCITLNISGNFQELGDRHKGKIFRAISWCWNHSFARMGEDWVFLAMLGFIMAVLSYVMDKGELSYWIIAVH